MNHIKITLENTKLHFTYALVLVPRRQLNARVEQFWHGKPSEKILMHRVTSTQLRKSFDNVHTSWPFYKIGQIFILQTESIESI